MPIKKYEFLSVLKYLIVFFCFLLFNSLLPSVSIFALSLLVALLFLKFSLFLTPVLYVLSFVVFKAFDNLLFLSVPALFFVVVFSFYKIFKAEMKAELLFYLVISLIPFCVFFENGDILTKIIHSLITIVLTFINTVAIKTIISKGLKFKPTLDEIFSLSVLLIALGLGLSNLISFEVYKAVAVFTILAFAFVYKAGISTVVAGVLSLPASIYFNDLSFTGIFVAISLFATLFMPISRHLSATSVILAEFLIQLFFSPYPVYNYLNLLSLSVGAMAFSIVPYRVLSTFKSKLFSFRDKQLIRQTINRNRYMLSNRLYEISSVFLEMGNVFTSLKKDILSEDKVKEHLKEKLLTCVCEECENRHVCRAKKSPNEKAVLKLISIGFAKGKISFIDLPKDITDNCLHSNNLIYGLNRLLGEYRTYVLDSLNTDAGKQLIASQAIGIADILKSLALETSQTLKYQNKLEKAVNDILTKHGFFASEILIYGEAEETAVSLVLCDKEIAINSLSSLVSKAVGIDMDVVEKAFVTDDKTFVLLKKLPDFDAVFGVAAAIKDGSNKSGDTHSVVRLQNDKFLVALSDGMGSGSYAEKVSDASLSLIESFYRSGMKSEFILNAINKVLSVNTEDTFTALDVAVIDLKTKTADFIKFGAPYGFILTSEGIKIIDGNSLPLGILDELKPTVVSTTLTQGDMLLFLTDGITDAFGSSSEVIDYLQTLPAKNPQTLADSVLNRAIELSFGNKKDDMTAVALRIFKRVA